MKEKYPPGTQPTNETSSSENIEQSGSFNQNKGIRGGENSFNPPNNIIEDSSSVREAPQTKDDKSKIYFLGGRYHCENCNDKGDRILGLTYSSRGSR